MLAYLNGEFVPRDEARISVDDRGFLFADGIYEVVRVHKGRTVAMREHLLRFEAGLRALQIDFGDVAGLADVARKLMEENGHDEGEATIYFQITRGTAPRIHAFPQPAVKPTVFITTRRFPGYPDDFFLDGVEAITVPDDRWARCDVKSISLLPNVLANQRAHAAGAFEALFVRDGIVLEGSHANVFAVLDGRLVTYPACNYILNGITRMQVLALAQELGIPGGEGFLPYARLFEAEEIFLSGTTTEVMPVVRVDGRKVFDGEPGPVTRKLQKAYRELI